MRKQLLTTGPACDAMTPRKALERPNGCNQLHASNECLSELCMPHPRSRNILNESMNKQFMLLFVARYKGTSKKLPSCNLVFLDCSGVARKVNRIHGSGKQPLWDTVRIDHRQYI